MRAFKKPNILTIKIASIQIGDVRLNNIDVTGPNDECILIVKELMDLTQKYAKGNSNETN